MKSIFAIILVLMLALMASAATEKVKFGPYTATFDLNTTDKYTVEAKNPTIEKPAQVEPDRWNALSLYSFEISKNDQSRARVSVWSWKNYSDASIYKDADIESLTLRSLGIKNVTATFDKIQGKTGFLMVARLNRPLTIAWYWLDKVDIPNSIASYGREKVRIAGNLTAQESISLLKTLKIEKS